MNNIIEFESYLDEQRRYKILETIIILYNHGVSNLQLVAKLNQCYASIDKEKNTCKFI